MSYSLKKLFPSFFETERIARFIWSPHNINPNTNNLRLNFFKFDFVDASQRCELSCFRFEFTRIKILRKIGKTLADPDFKRNYYGVGVTTIGLLRTLDFVSIAFTPFTSQRVKFYFHADIYDDSNDCQLAKGEAAPAATNLRKDAFAKIWQPRKDDQSKSYRRQVVPIDW